MSEAAAEGSGSPPVDESRATAPFPPAEELVRSEYSEEAEAAAAEDRRMMDEMVAELDPVEYGGPVPPEGAVDIRDEAAQKNFDQMVVSEAIRNLRQGLANQKVNYWLAAKGLTPPGAKLPHPQQIKAEIKKTRAQLAWLIEVSQSNEAIEYPSDIEIATAVPR